MNKERKELLKQAFEAPPPEGKREFLAKLRPREVGTAEMLLTQAAYIRPVVWAASAFVLAAAMLGVTRIPESAVRLLGAVTPFAAAAGLGETNRSRRCRMAELEQATRFSLRSIVCARMLVIGAVQLAVLLLSSALLSHWVETSVVYLVAGIMIPYLITAALGLHIERTVWGRNNAYLSVALAAVTALAVLWSDTISVPLPDLLSWGGSVLAAGGLLALTVWEAFQTLRLTEDCT